MNRNSNKTWSFLICLALTLATTAVFCQVCTYDFVNYDDPIYVYENPNIQAGITLKAVKWAFTTGYLCQLASVNLAFAYAGLAAFWL